MIMRSFYFNSEQELHNMAKRLSAICSKGNCLCLNGSLGLGKTSFSRAFIQSLCGANTYVTSPTFSLLQIYSATDVNIYHFDLYRVNEPSEVWELGLDEAISEGITIIEWSEKLLHLKPRKVIDINFFQGDEEKHRRLEVVDHYDSLAWNKFNQKV